MIIPVTSPHEKREALRRALQQPALVFAPSVSDPMTARLVESLGLPAVHCAGSGLHRQAGYADAGILTLTEMTGALAQICAAISIPVIADGDTGFGGIANVLRTVEEYERAGAAAIHLEDQLTPKRPPTGGESNPTISRREMVNKIRAAVDSRFDDSLIVIARSEVKDDIGEVIERSRACVGVGADAVWIPGGYRVEDVTRLHQAVDVPLVGVLPSGSSLDEYHERGANCAVLPTWLDAVAVRAKTRLLEQFISHGTASEYLARLEGIDRSRAFVQGQGKDKLDLLTDRYG